MHIIILGIASLLGAFLRGGISFLFMKVFPTFPVGTILINLLGSFLIGITHALYVSSTISDPWRTYLTMGFLGAFTTFSAFSLDALLLFEAGKIFACFSYLSLSVFGGFLSCMAGMSIIRFFVKIVA